MMLQCCSLACLLVERASNRFQHAKTSRELDGSFSAQIRGMTNPEICKQLLGCCVTNGLYAV